MYITCYCHFMFSLFHAIMNVAERFRFDLCTITCKSKPGKNNSLPQLSLLTRIVENGVTTTTILARWLVENNTVVNWSWHVLILSTHFKFICVSNFFFKIHPQCLMCAQFAIYSTHATIHKCTLCLDNQISTSDEATDSQCFPWGWQTAEHDKCILALLCNMMERDVSCASVRHGW